MDKAIKTQFSLAFFVLGLAMILIRDLKNLDAIPLEISQYFPLIFYLGLIFMLIAYYLK